MRSTYLAAGALTLLGLFSACGSDEHAPTAGDPNGRAGSGGKSTGAEGGADEGGTGGSKGGKGGNGGTLSHAGRGGGIAMPDGGAGGEGAEGGAPPEPVGAPPTVSIVSPTAVTDPLSGKVLVKDTVDVTCKATKGTGADAGDVDPMGVNIAVLDKTGTEVLTQQQALLQPNTDLYVAKDLLLTKSESGKVVFRCTAQSLTTAVGTGTLSSLVDRGPKVVITAPADKANLALKSPATFTFTATPAPLTGTGDTQADVASVKLTIDGVVIPTAPTGKAGEYQAKDVNLNGPLFTNKPSEDTNIAVSATNKRTPEAATGTASSVVFVDADGPIISVTSPHSADVVGGIVTVKFSVVDTGSNVNDDSVSVSIGTKSHAYNDDVLKWKHTPGTGVFEYSFDSRDKAEVTSDVQATITVRAADNVGNLAKDFAVPVYLDNKGPQVDLDPLNVRVINPQTKNCSKSFDPVGTRVPNDKAQTGGYDTFRALVWEQTEVGNPNSPLFFAGTNDKSVRLFIRRPDDATALLINAQSPGTGVCNEIKDNGISGESIELKPLPRDAGTPVFDGNKNLAPADDSICQYPAITAPLNLCNNNSDMSKVVARTKDDLYETAIYAFSPASDPVATACTGQPWNYTDPAAVDGWVCMAVRAEDKLGNVGISPPLRVCLDDPNRAGHPDCDPAKAPSCTDGCTPPTRGGNFITQSPN